MSIDGTIRVCQVLYAIRPVYTGAGEQAIYLGKALQRRGVEVEFLTANHTASPSHGLIEGIPVHRLKVLGKSNPWRDRVFALRAVSYLLRHRYDVWHFHGSPWAAYLSLLVPRLLRPPALLRMTLMGNDDPYTIHRQHAGDLKVRALTRAEVIDSISDQLTQSFLNFMREHYLVSPRVVTLTSGVDTERFKPMPEEQKGSLRRRLGLPTDGLLVGYVGQVVRRKGVDILLDAFQPLAERHPVHLCLVGPSCNEGLWTDPDFGPELKPRLALPGLHGRVICTGRVDNPWEYLQAMDVFVLPARAEGQPTVLLEAMACGLPCVVMAAGWEEGVIEDGVNGVIFPYEDTVVLTTLLEKLFGNPELRRRLGQGALKSVQQRYTADQVGVQYAELYRELLSGKKRAL